jgi:hypothetical protein
MTIENTLKKTFISKITRMTTAAALFTGLPLLGIYGCAQLPMEKQGVSDMRPHISFKSNDPTHHSARVIVDGLDMGSLGAYLDGIAALRIISGSHQIRVVLDTRVLFENKFYVDDGVSRTFLVQ